MIDKMIRITIGEKEYPLAFTLNVMENIQEKYGSTAKWGEMLDGIVEPSFKDIIWTFEQMVNEGIDIDNDERNENTKPLTHKQVGRLITQLSIPKTMAALRNAVTAAKPKEDEEEKQR